MEARHDPSPRRDGGRSARRRSASCRSATWSARWRRGVAMTSWASTRPPHRSARRPARPRSSTRPARCATTVLDVARLRRRVQQHGRRRLPPRRRRRRAAERDRRRPQRHPARDRRDARLQRPRAADPRVHPRRLRRLHDLRQRLSRHRDPRPSPSPSRSSTRRSRRSPPDEPEPAARRRHGLRRHFARTTEVRRRAQPAAASSRRSFGIFVDPVHCKGCARVRRGLRTPSATTP